MLGSHEEPDLIGMDLLTVQIPKPMVLVDPADRARLAQDLQDRVPGRARDTDRGPNGHTLVQAGQDLRPPLVGIAYSPSSPQAGSLNGNISPLDHSPRESGLSPRTPLRAGHLLEGRHGPSPDHDEILAALA